MGRILVGHLKNLWRYPVKSMQGEALEASAVRPQGLLGDRTHALWDHQTSRVASAKNPKKWATLLDCQARFLQSPQVDQPLPAVQIDLPNGTTVNSQQSNVHSQLSQWVGREVQFLATVPEQPSLDQYWPDVEGTAHRDTVTQLFMPPGTFFDSCSVHAVTTATLEQLQALPRGYF